MTATQAAEDSSTETPETESRSEAKRSVRVRQLDLRNTWGIIAGALLLPLGIALIIIGWHGAAYANVDQKQLPYLISGGILGLAIVVIGCFFYWSHWLYRIYDQADVHHQELLREQRELTKVLIEALTAVGGRSGGAAGPGSGIGISANGVSAARTFVATATGSNFHTSGCPMVANRPGSLRTVTEEEAGEMKPCRVCEPLVPGN
ncbi:MAG TPA: hypothetical protein VKI19_13500 [Acidimicrobiales bacterium]|nr:hypothetical protein [Acidimicrobiales bacterium]